VSISSSDVGFSATNNCGNWTRIGNLTAASTGATSPASIESNRAKSRIAR
jgi:hypothetical protein